MEPSRTDWNPLAAYESGDILYFSMPDVLYVGAVHEVTMDPLGFLYAIFTGPVWQILEKQAIGGDENRGPIREEYDILDGGPLCISGIPGLKIGRAEDLWPLWRKTPWATVERVTRG